MIYHNGKGNKNEAHALPHQKCYRNEAMPQIENVTQIKLRAYPGIRPG
jgi:hypothetical protein